MADNADGKVVSLINMKGGVGKTTVAVGLAWELAASNRTLLVDVDPQFNATQWLVPTRQYIGWIRDRTKRTVFDIFQPESGATGGIAGARAPRPRPAGLTNTIIDVSHGGVTLGVLPSRLDLITLDATPRGTENRLNLFLQAARKKYDYILIDCPPTASLFSFSAYLASDAYLVPLKPDPLSVLGLPLLERAVTDYEDRSGHRAERLGLVLTLVRQTRAMNRLVEQIESDHAGEVFAARLQQATGIAEAVEASQPLQIFRKTRARLRQPLTDLATEFVSRVDQL
jgi:chromosome partitioning protein